MPLAARHRRVGPELPYGIDDLDALVRVVSQRPRTVRCYVRGCEQELETPRRGHAGTVCPEHGVYCHHSSVGSTYNYRDVRRNIIASPDLFAHGIVGHPFKYESHRLGLERSEDTLSWNVFRSFAEAGQLARVAQAITGTTLTHEPHLYLWGISACDDDFLPWPLLEAARERFESNLPVDRPLTEPDIALHLPGKYLILIEATFTSPNTFYQHGPRTKKDSLTLAELLSIYRDNDLRILDHARAEQAHRVAYQLWRNTVFAEWMARQDHPRTMAYHVNLVRSGYESDTAAEFAELVTEDHLDRFDRLTWERLYELAEGVRGLERLRRYLETKTAGLIKAFRV
ncbi:MAG: hypothetical protein R3C10_28175 [Pirellulales bacterium]